MYSILNEPNILQRLNKYNFGIKLISSFKDYESFYLVTTFFEGKTLDNYKDEFLDENKIKFISACIIQLFIYLRIEQIIHRDIRLENIIMDSDKYFNIIDFTYSINFNDKNNPKYYLKNDEKYIAPEVSKRKEYNYTADYYALGSIIYYLIFKNFPNVIKKKRKLIHLL